MDENLIKRNIASRKSSSKNERRAEYLFHWHLLSDFVLDLGESSLNCSNTINQQPKEKEENRSMLLTHWPPMYFLSMPMLDKCVSPISNRNESKLFCFQSTFERKSSSYFTLTRIIGTEDFNIILIFAN